MAKITGWGRYPVVEGVERVSEILEEATRGACLTRGLGRSYGDASLPPRAGATVAGSRLADRFLGFEPRTGVLRAEAGLSLASLQDAVRSRGWSTPVAPGTEFVTLGGMVASDVHGKNHHRAGSFGEHVRALRMQLADGRVLEVTEQTEAELFRATLGGLGLTGHVLEVELQLERIPSPWIWQEIEPVADLEALLEKLPAASQRWPFTVCWVDCLTRGRGLGRGILIKGRWAEPDEAPAHAPPRRRSPRLPIDLPGWVLGRWSVSAFNTLYYHLRARRSRRGVVHPRPFFHPLDAIRDWNRAYGRRGLTQYQPVLPPDESGASFRRFFELLTRSGEASFLCVAKDFGPEGRGLLSFPRPGLTFNVDLPVRGARTRAVVEALNQVVLEAGGRIYLAKDIFTPPEQFRAMEPRLAAFQEVRRRWDPQSRLSSALAVRLFGDPS